MSTLQTLAMSAHGSSNSNEPLMMMGMQLSALVVGAFLLQHISIQRNRTLKTAASLFVAMPLVAIPLTYAFNRDYFARSGGRIASWLNSDVGVTLMGAITEGIVAGVVIAILINAFRTDS